MAVLIGLSAPFPKSIKNPAFGVRRKSMVYGQQHYSWRNPISGMAPVFYKWYEYRITCGSYHRKVSGGSSWSTMENDQPRYPKTS